MIVKFLNKIVYVDGPSIALTSVSIFGLRFTFHVSQNIH